MPVHTIKLDYETKKLLHGELLKEMKNMNHERRNPPRRYSDQHDIHHPLIKNDRVPNRLCMSFSIEISLSSKFFFCQIFWSVRVMQTFHDLAYTSSISSYTVRDMARAGAFSANFDPAVLDEFRSFCSERREKYTKVLEQLAVAYLRTKGELLAGASVPSPQEQLHSTARPQPKHR